MARDGQLQAEQDEPEHDQDQAADVERQAPEADERQDQRQPAEDAGDEVRVVELGQQAGRADAEQEERDRRVRQQPDERSGTGSCPTSVTVAPVEVERDRLARDLDRSCRSRTRARPRSSAAIPSTTPSATASLAGDDRASLDRRDGPVDVAVARLGDRGDLGDRVVLDLLAERARRCPRPRRRPARRRRCDVPGAISAMFAASVMNVPALAANPPAGATQTMTGTFASSSVADDVVRRGQRAAGRVELDDDGRGAVALGPGDAVVRGTGPCPGRRCPVVGSRITCLSPRGERRRSQRQRRRQRATGPRRRRAMRRPTGGATSCTDYRITRERRRGRRQPRGTRRRGGSTSRGRRRRPRPPAASANAPLSLSVSRIVDRPARGVGDVDRAEVDAARPSVVSSLSSPTSRKSGTKSATSSSSPLAAKPAQQVAVARVQVAADADRPAVVEAGVAAGPRPAHEEVARRRRAGRGTG